MEVEGHQDLHQPNYGARRNLKNTLLPEEESMNQHHYGLRQNPKKKTHNSFGLESPESRILFRCEECGKGFRYEKCLSNHQEVVHSLTKQTVHEKEEEEDPMKSLCDSFSLVTKKKRSKVIRYRKTPLSCSFTTFLDSPSVFAANDEELEVAESLILLSKGSPKLDDGLKLVSEAMVTNFETPQGSYDSGCLSNKKPRKAGVFESGGFSNEQECLEERLSRYETLKEQASEFESDHRDRRKAVEFKFGCWSDEQNLLNEVMTTDETFKEPSSFLGHKCQLDQQGLRKSSEYGYGFLNNEKTVMEGSGSTNETWKDSASCMGENTELNQWEMQKSGDFESRVLSSKLRVVGATECSDSDTENFYESNKENFEHQCKLCNKVFSSYQALGGHQTVHRLRQSQMKKHCRYESVEEPDDDSVSVTVKKEKTKPTCSICSRRFRSVYALGGHKKSHSKRQDSKTEDNHHHQDLGFLSAIPIFFNDFSF